MNINQLDIEKFLIAIETTPTVADTMINEARKGCDINFVNALIQQLGNTSISENQQNICCLTAKNFFHSTQIEYKVQIFQKYQQSHTKNSRTQNIQIVKSKLNELPFAYMLLAALIEQDAQQKLLPYHRQIVEELVDQQSISSIKCLHYLFEQANLHTANEILQKQKNFYEKIFNIVVQQVGNLEMVQFLTGILAKIIPNLIPFTKQIIEQTNQMLQSLVSMQIDGNKYQINIINNCINIYTEAAKIKQKDIIDAIQVILDIFKGFLDQYIQTQSQDYYTIIVNILQFFKQIDTCNYEENFYIINNFLIPLFKCESNQQITQNSFISDTINIHDETHELLNQFLKHYYIQYKDNGLKTLNNEQTIEYTKLLNNLNYQTSQSTQPEHVQTVQQIQEFNNLINNQLNLFEQLLTPSILGFGEIQFTTEQIISNLTYFTYIQPLWRHNNLQQSLIQINNQILEYFNDVTQNNMQKYQYYQIHNFLQYLNQFIIYSPKQQFIDNWQGCETVIKIFINYLENVQSMTYFQLLNSFLNKLYICEYQQFSNVVNTLMESVMKQIVIISKSQNAIIKDILQAFHQCIAFNSFLFQQKIFIYLQTNFVQSNDTDNANDSQQKFTRERLTFRQGDIQIRQYYNIILNQEKQTLNIDYCINQSLQTVVYVSNIAFNLLEAIRNRDTQEFMIMINNSLTLINSCVLSLSEMCVDSQEVFTRQQLITPMMIIDGILPKICDYYLQFLQNVTKYEDQLTNSLDVIASISQLAQMNNISIIQVLQQYQQQQPISQKQLDFSIIYISITDPTQGIMLYNDTQFFVHAVTFLCTLVQSAPETEIQLYIQYCNDNLKQKTLSMQSRTVLNYLLSQLILFQKFDVISYQDDVMEILLNSSQILSQSQQMNNADALLISTLSLASSYYNFCKQAKHLSDSSGERNVKIFDQLFQYIKNIVFEDLFKLLHIELLLETFVGLIGSMKVARNVVAKPLINALLKKCTAILTGIQDDQNAEIILQGFMSDYNKALQGIDML